MDVDVNECDYGTHTCDDSERADCINNEGSYTCACKPGFVGNGESCQIIGIIAILMQQCILNTLP